MANPKFTSVYTGQDVESAISKALQLDTFEHQSDEVINGNIYHVLWKVKPTTTNQVSGIAVHPLSGKLVNILSLNGIITADEYLSDGDAITTTEIDELLK